mgnify:CR=1 FL=1
MNNQKQRRNERHRYDCAFDDAFKVRKWARSINGPFGRLARHDRVLIVSIESVGTLKSASFTTKTFNYNA